MKSTTLLRGWLVLAASLLIASCSGGDSKKEEDAHAGHAHDEAGHEEMEHGEDREERVTLSSEAIAASGIVVETAGPREIEITLDLPGEVVPNADRLAHIVPRFPGITKEVLKGLGDHVRQGEALAVIESNESLSPYTVSSLISGTIIEKHITLGEFVRDDSDVYVVADLSSVWVNASVYARDLSRIRTGMTAHVTAVGGSPSASAEIDYVGPVLGETTRAATARLVLPNGERAWRPGMFVVARVVTDEASAPVAVQDGALQRYEEHDVVFVEEHGGFEPRPVRLGRTDGEWTEILEGLSAGERYVAEGSFIIKSELLKSTAGHEH